MKQVLFILFTLGTIIFVFIRFFLIPKPSASPRVSPFSTFVNGGGVSSRTTPVSPTPNQTQIASQSQTLPENPDTATTVTSQQNALVTPTPYPLANRQKPNLWGNAVLPNHISPTEIPSFSTQLQQAVPFQEKAGNSATVQPRASAVALPPTNTVRTFQFVQSSRNTFLAFVMNIWLLLLSHNPHTN